MKLTIATDGNHTTKSSILGYQVLGVTVAVVSFMLVRVYVRVMSWADSNGNHQHLSFELVVSIE